MINKCVCRIVEWLMRYGTIDDGEQEVYEYALISFTLTAIPLVLTLIVGIVLDGLAESMILILPFMMIRKFCGGYHAKSMWVCLCSSTVVLSFVVFLSTHIQCGIMSTLIFILSTVILLANSPIDSKQRRLNKEDCKYFKKVVLIILTVFWLAYVILAVCGYGKISVSISCGIDLAAILQLPCLVLKFKLDHYLRKD